MARGTSGVLLRDLFLPAFPFSVERHLTPYGCRAPPAGRGLGGIAARGLTRPLSHRPFAATFSQTPWVLNVGRVVHCAWYPCRIRPRLTNPFQAADHCSGRPANPHLLGSPAPRTNGLVQPTREVRPARFWDEGVKTNR